MALRHVMLPVKLTWRMTLLKQIRELTGKTQEEVAADLGISVSTVNRHEQGKTPLTRMLVLAYAAYYGVDPDSIEQPGTDA